MQYLFWSLVCVISAGAVVRSQRESPYLHFRGGNLTNHSYVNLNQVGSVEDTNEIQCRTDLVTCCNSESGPDRGDWFGPDGTRLPFSGDGIIHLIRRPRYVAVRRNGLVGPSDEGIYQCTIETNAVMSDDNTAREILYVGVYFIGGDVTIPDDISFKEITDPDEQISGYVLTCISIEGPVTNITWTRDSESVTEGTESVLVNRVTAQYNHTLTVTGRLEGNYTCTVSNNKPSTSLRELRVEVPDAPTDLQVSQNGQSSVLVSWTPGSGDRTVSYTITLTPLDGGTAVQAEVEGNVTNTIVMGLMEAAYSVSIVANSNTFSSTSTGPEYITLGRLFVTLSVSPGSPAMIGDSVSISCSATIPDGVIGTPFYEWEGPGGSISASGPENVSDISTIRLSQAGRYVCTVNIGFFIVTNSTDIVVLIPLPQPTIVDGRSGPLYAATSYNLTCDYTLHGLIDTALRLMVDWRVDGSSVSTSQSRITAANDSIIFNPLATSDSGSYVCVLTLPAQEYVAVLDPQEQQSSPVEITVEDLPLPEVTTTSDTVRGIGDQLTLQCTVSVVSFLTTEPTLVWVDPVGGVLSSGTGELLTHTMNVDRTSIAGVYVCRVTIEVEEIALSIAREGRTALTVQIPLPSVVVNSDREGILYAGTSLTFTCDVSLDSSVDTPTNVIVMWTGPRPIPGEWYTVTDTAGSDFAYSHSLSIVPLADDRDDGVYTCTAAVAGSDYILEAENSSSTTLDVTGIPTLVVSITSDGTLLTSQSYTFQCAVTVVDGLLQSPSIELLAPDGFSLLHQPSTTSLQYTLSSLDSTDDGEYTCIAVLAIPGSGIDRQAMTTKYITVVDAYPIEELTLLSRGNSSLLFSWKPPALGHDFTTGFTLTCTPLLNGIPVPPPVSTSTRTELTLSITRLYSGVPYNCSLVTVTSQGQSEPRSIVQTTEEIAPSGVPLSFRVVVGVTDATFTWSPPEVTLRNGEITEYTLSCSSGTSLMLLTTFMESGTHRLEGFSASTDYNCSIWASNSGGRGPSTSLLIKTQDATVETAGSSAGFSSGPVVGGVVGIVFILAVMVIVIVVVVIVTKRRRNKYSLNRARPNSYVMRTADSASATVTTNENVAEYTVVKSQAAGAALGPEYEMFPSYSQLPAGKRLAPGYVPGGVDITANASVTLAIGNDSKGIVPNPQYAMIRTYSNIGPSTNVYEDPQKMELGPDMQTNDSHYAVPCSPSPQPTALPTGSGEAVPSLYAVPRGPDVAQTQGIPPPPSIAERGSHNLYNVPHNRRDTTTVHQSRPAPSPQDDAQRRQTRNPYNHLEVLQPPSLPPPNVTTRTGSTGQTSKPQTTYDVPRSSSVTSDKSRSHYVEIDLGNIGSKPALPPTAGGNVSSPSQPAEEQGVTIYTNVSNTSN